MAAIALYCGLELCLYRTYVREGSGRRNVHQPTYNQIDSNKKVTGQSLITNSTEISSLVAKLPARLLINQRQGTMFLMLCQTKLMAEPGTLSYPPEPPPEYIPPIGASINTWPNIVKNKENIDFCVGEFYHLMNRLVVIFHFSLFENSPTQLTDKIAGSIA